LYREILDRVLSYSGEGRRKASPMDIWVLVHPGFKQVALLHGVNAGDLGTGPQNISI
jgi:hypothetical protein